MKITDTLKDRIITHEGIRYSPYTDSVGQKTIGIGHAIRGDENSMYPNTCEISEKEVLYLFDKDLERAIVGAKDLIGTLVLPLEIQEVIVEMVFQLGKSGVRKFKFMWAALNKGFFLEAAHQMRKSRWHRQTPSRCNELASIVENIGNKKMSDEVKEFAEFKVHVLPQEDLEVIKQISRKFDKLLSELPSLGIINCRELSLVHLKLEEACFYAKKAYASHCADLIQ